MSGLDDRLTSAFDSVRAWSPDPDGRFPVVAERARRRQAAQRAVAAAAVVMALVGVAGAVALTDGPGGERVTAADSSEGGEGGGPVDRLLMEQTSPTAPVAVPDGVPPQPTPSVPVTAKPDTGPPRSTTTTTTTAPPAPIEPPAAYVSAKGAEVEAARGSSCWKSGDGMAGQCADVSGEFADDAPVLSVVPGDVVMVRWATREQPKTVEAYLLPRTNGVTDWGARQPVSCEGGNPCRFTVKAKPGEYVLYVGSWWAQGDAAYGVRLAVGTPTR